MYLILSKPYLNRQSWSDTILMIPPDDTRPPDIRPTDTRPPDTRPPDTRPPDTRPPDTTHKTSHIRQLSIYIKRCVCGSFNVLINFEIKGKDDLIYLSI